MSSEPQFKVGDRVFSHYTMQWGTVAEVRDIAQNGSCWYWVDTDRGGRDYLDDGAGNWDMARIIPPHIATKYGFGRDPKETK